MSDRFQHHADCVFCRIISGDIPCHKIYEDQSVLCFLDIEPVVAGHTLVIPKQHTRNIFTMSPEIFSQLGLHLPALARAVCAAVEASSCHILLNNGIEAMQSVPHAHYHIIPRKIGDTFNLPWNPGKLASAEGQSLLHRIQQEYANTEKQANSPEKPI